MSEFIYGEFGAKADSGAYDYDFGKAEGYVFADEDGKGEFSAFAYAEDKGSRDKAKAGGFAEVTEEDGDFAGAGSHGEASGPYGSVNKVITHLSASTEGNGGEGYADIYGKSYGGGYGQNKVDLSAGTSSYEDDYGSSAESGASVYGQGNKFAKGYIESVSSTDFEEGYASVHGYVEAG